LSAKILEYKKLLRKNLTVSASGVKSNFIVDTLKELRQKEIENIEKELRKSKDRKMKLKPGTIVNECCLISPYFLYLN